MTASRIVLAAILALAAAPAFAQTAPPAAPPAAPVVRPEYSANIITLAQAKVAVAAAEAEARRNGWQVVITIVEPNGTVVMSEKIDGTQYGSVEVSKGKAMTAAQFRRPSSAFAEGMKTSAAPLALGVVPVEGGELILVDGRIIGAIGVSGVTSAQDGQIARAGAAAVK